MNKKKIIIFLIINFGLSWIIGFYGYFNNIKVFSNTYIFLAVVYMFIPTVSTLIVQKYIYRDKIIKPFDISFKINRWFFIAWIIPIIIAFLTCGISILMPKVSYSHNMQGFLTQYQSILSEAQFEQIKMKILSSNFPTYLLITIQALFAGFTVNAVAGFGEELGWRGFLQNELSILGFWRSSFLIGFIWGIWHLPLILMGHNYPEHPLMGIILMTVLGIVLGPILSFVRLKSNSIIAPSICHGTFNASLSLATLYVVGGNDLIIGMTGLSGLIAIVLVDISIFIYLKIEKRSENI